MRLKNYTIFPNDWIREIVQFVKPNNLPTQKFDVKVTNSEGKYCGVFYEGGGYAKSGIGSDPNRPLIIVRISPDEKMFPCKENNTPTRTVRLYFDKYNEKKGIWQQFYKSYRIPVTKAYIARRDRRLKDQGKFYGWNKSNGGYIDCLVLSKEEALVHVMAHELRHLWQKNHPGKRGKVWGTRGQYSDRDADAYAIKKMRSWRRLHNYKTTEFSWDVLENVNQ